MTIIETLQSVVTGGVAGAIVAWIAQTIALEKLRHDYAAKLETHRAELQRKLAETQESFRQHLAEQDRLNRDRWELKRNASLDALTLVDKVMTHLSHFAAEGETRVPPEPFATSDARSIMNRLILACDDPSVVHLFLTCIGLDASGGGAAGIDPGNVQDLRNAIRRELGFGQDLNLNPSLSWIISVHGDGVIS